MKHLSDLEKSALYGCAISYYENAWHTKNESINYGNSNTPLDGRSTCNQLDCSSFIISCLLGVDYANSPFCGHDMPINGKLGISRKFETTSNNKTGLLRYAYEILMYGEKHDLMYEPKSIEDYETGDIVFWKWKDKYLSETTSSFAKNAYKNIAHVGMIITDCDKFKEGLGLLHCVSTSALMQYREFLTYKAENIELYPYIMRPNISCREYTVNGYWRFRKNLSNLYIGNSGYTFTGGGVPIKTENIFIHKGTGDTTVRKDRITTDYIPYSKSIFVRNNLNTCGYNICFYDRNKKFLGYSQNKSNVNLSAVLCRIEFYKKSGDDFTSQETSFIKQNNQIIYHDFSDKETPSETGFDSILYHSQECIKYFPNPTRISEESIRFGESYND